MNDTESHQLKRRVANLELRVAKLEALIRAGVQTGAPNVAVSSLPGDAHARGREDAV